MRFEITRIPIHLWSDLTVTKIGQCLGEVIEIHDVKHSMDTAEVTIRLDERRIIQKSIILKEGQYIYFVWIHKIKVTNSNEVEGLEFEMSASQLGNSSQKEPLLNCPGEKGDGVAMDANSFDNDLVDDESEEDEGDSEDELYKDHEPVYRNPPIDVYLDDGDNSLDPQINALDCKTSDNDFRNILRSLQIFSQYMKPLLRMWKNTIEPFMR